MLKSSDLSGLITVNKETAQYILNSLTSNESQRKPDPKKVTKLAKIMVAGAWQDRGETIVISTTHRRLDGNHRLLAVIEADVEVQLRFINDVPDVQDGKEIFQFIDSETRKPHDVLSIEYKHLNHTKGVTTLIAQLETFALQALWAKPHGMKLTNQGILDIAEKHRPLETLDMIVDRGHTLADRSGTLHGKTVRGRLIDVKESSLLNATIGVCENGNNFLEELVGLTEVDGSIIHRQNGHELDNSNLFAKCVIALNSITNSDKKDKRARRYAVIFDAYNYYVEGNISIEKNLVQSRIVYPLDYDRYTDI